MSATSPAKPNRHNGRQRASLTHALTIGGSTLALALALITTLAPSALAAAPPAAGEATSLIDGRAWELVTPPDKHGAALKSPEKSESDGIVEAAEGGGALTYLMDAPPTAQVEASRPFEVTQVLGRRGADGWSATPLTTPSQTVGDWELNDLNEYKRFNNSLTEALLEPPGTSPLSPEQTGDEQTLYSRDLGSGAFTALVTSHNVVEPELFAKAQRPVRYDGSSSNLQHVVVSSTMQLTQQSTSANYNLYELSNGATEPQLVNLLPDNHTAVSAELGDEPLGAGEPTGESTPVVRHAVSDDGRLVVWGAVNEFGDDNMYVRDTATHETVQLDIPQGSVTHASNERMVAVFNAAVGAGFEEASSAPPHVLFSDEVRLTPNSHAEQGSPDLYAAALHFSPLTVTLTDLTPGTGSESSNFVPYIMSSGQSAEGTTIYYHALGALAPGALAGQSNLYEQRFASATDAWEAPRTVAVTSEGDSRDWGGHEDLEKTVSRSSPNGRFFAFMSELPLTGYDNRDAVSGVPDQEVYLFDSQTGSVRCVSCNPTGARPHGRLEPPTYTAPEPLLTDPTEIFAEKWVAANLMGWDSIHEQNEGYQPRSVSDSGRVFFDSGDGLVPADTNEAQDVYEYEPEGAEGGACSGAAASTTTVLIDSPAVREGKGVGSLPGCVGLISSGKSGSESAFLDATESGSDVFFATGAQLVPQDTDAAYDIYDAHECSEASPCLSSSVSMSSPCASAEACRGTVGGDVAPVGALVSATPSGEGNLAGPAPAVVQAKTKPLTRAQKLAGALKSCKRLKVSNRRTKCERTARSKYAPPQKARKANRRSK